MGVKIDMGNVKISGSARWLNNASIRENEDTVISMNGVEILENAAVLENLNIEPFLKELQTAVNKTDVNSPEYNSMKQIVESRDKNKDTIVKMIAKHIGTFSQGVLENVLAAYISRGW